MPIKKNQKLQQNLMILICVNNLFIPFTNKKGEYKYSTYKNEKKRSWTSDGYKQQTNRNKTKQIDKRKK